MTEFWNNCAVWFLSDIAAVTMAALNIKVMWHTTGAFSKRLRYPQGAGRSVSLLTNGDSHFGMPELSVRMLRFAFSNRVVTDNSDLSFADSGWLSLRTTWSVWHFSSVAYSIRWLSAGLEWPHVQRSPVAVLSNLHKNLCQPAVNIGAR